MKQRRMLCDEFYDELKAGIRTLGEWPGTDIEVTIKGQRYEMRSIRDGRRYSFKVPRGDKA